MATGGSTPFGDSWPRRREGLGSRPRWKTYGPYAVCEPQAHWADADPDRRAHLLARQGVGMVRTDGPRVVEFLAELPLTSTGKVQKVQLKEREWAGHTQRVNG